jgi:predicted transcriptional regulator
MAEVDKKSVFDTPPDEAEEARRDAKADAEIEAGKGVPHEQVRQWLLKLARGERVPPPAV